MATKQRSRTRLFAWVGAGVLVAAVAVAGIAWSTSNAMRMDYRAAAMQEQLTRAGILLDESQATVARNQWESVLQQANDRLLPALQDAGSAPAELVSAETNAAVVALAASFAEATAADDPAAGQLDPYAGDSLPDADESRITRALVERARTAEADAERAAAEVAAELERVTAGLEAAEERVRSAAETLAPAAAEALESEPAWAAAHPAGNPRAFAAAAEASRASLAEFRDTAEPTREQAASLITNHAALVTAALALRDADTAASAASDEPEPDLETIWGP